MAQERLGGLTVRELEGPLRLFEADSRRARRRGLAALDDLPASWALHLAPCRSVHTVGMRFTLDLVWLDRHGLLVRLDEAVAARRLRTCLRARSVVEARSGSGRAFADALEREVG